MSLLVLLLLVLAAGFFVTLTAKAQLNEFPVTEIYTWKPEGQEWHFSIFFSKGRGILKTEEQITNPKFAFSGMDELKKRLSKVDDGAIVVWRNVGKENLPDAILEELKRFCATKRLKLVKMAYHDVSKTSPTQQPVPEEKKETQKK
jgi:hypothetical protein